MVRTLYAMAVDNGLDVCACKSVCFMCQMDAVRITSTVCVKL